MQSRLFALGAALLATAVAGGALGAHALRARLDGHGLELWHTAFRYVAIAGVGLCLTGLAAERRPDRRVGAAGLCLGLGGLLFGATVAALALGAPPWLGAVTPVGGVLMIGGFALLAAAAWRR